MRENFVEWYPYSKNRAILARAEGICFGLKADGYDISLRQLFYALVSTGVIANDQKTYKNLGELISNARLAGLFDWDFIVDRGRTLQGMNHYTSVGQAVTRLASRYRLDKWADQGFRIEVWVEKDALSGVIARPAIEHDIDFFACKGYVSQSEMYAAAKRFDRYAEAGQEVVILHFGDHDPSGLDMTRDIQKRLALMTAIPPTVERLALSIEQVRELNPPPNPVKFDDSRADGYIEEFGRESWELDALPPRELARLVTEGVEQYLEPEKFDAILAIERTDRDRLEGVAAHWPAVVALAEKEFEFPDVAALEADLAKAEDLADRVKTKLDETLDDLAATKEATRVSIAALKGEVEEAREEAKHALKEKKKKVDELDGWKILLRNAMNETADTTRASALKKKIEEVLG